MNERMGQAAVGMMSEQQRRAVDISLKTSTYRETGK